MMCIVCGVSGGGEGGGLCKIVSLRRYDSFNSLIVLHDLELLMRQKSCKNKLNFFTLKVTETACTCITSLAKASVYILC